MFYISGDKIKLTNPRKLNLTHFSTILPSRIYIKGARYFRVIDDSEKVKRKWPDQRSKIHIAITLTLNDAHLSGTLLIFSKTNIEDNINHRSIAPIINFGRGVTAPSSVIKDQK